MGFIVQASYIAVKKRTMDSDEGEKRSDVGGDKGIAVFQHLVNCLQVATFTLE